MRCRICHRELRDPESLLAGIGPVCRRHRGVMSQLSLFEEPREREGVFHGRKVAMVHAPILASLKIVDDQGGPPKRRWNRVWNRNGLLAFLGQAFGLRHEVIDFDALRGLRAPWWLRCWRWIVRRVVWKSR